MLTQHIVSHRKGVTGQIESKYCFDEKINTHKSENVIVFGVGQIFHNGVDSFENERLNEIPG